jgi:drug/metabolite transporter (DMT)-like permease
MGFYRLSLALLIITPASIRRRRTKRLPGREVLWIPALAGLFTALDHAIWNTAIHFTSAANATLLNNTAPLWVALIALWLFRERLRGLFWAGLALTLTGAAAVLGSDFLRQMTLGWGDMLAICSGIFYAGYFLATQRGRQYLDTLSYIWIVGFFSSLVLLVICLVLRLPLTGYPTKTYLAFIGAAIIPQLGGYLSVGYAQGHLPASVVSPTMIGQPVMTALLAIPLLGEILHGYQILGGLVVLVGIYMVHRSRTLQNDAEDPADI